MNIRSLFMDAITYGEKPMNIVKYVRKCIYIYETHVACVARIRMHGYYTRGRNASQ